jgi:peptidoglycan-N-acetylglucosamine deacetylase
MCRMKRTSSVMRITLVAGAALLLGSVRANEKPPLEFWGFTGPWDPRSAESVRNFGGRLDVLVTGWIALDSASARPIIPTLYPDTVRAPRRNVSRFAMVTSWHGQHFHPTTIRRLASDRRLLADVASSVARHASGHGYGGLVLDFEGLDRGDVESLVTVVRGISSAAKRAGVRRVAIAVPAVDTAAYPARRLLEVADLVLVMLYDQHWSTSPPGAISDPAWVRQALALRVSEAGAERLVAGFPTYGYRWVTGQPTELLSYVDARRIASSAGTPLRRDPATQTLMASKPGMWELWVTDADLLRALMRAAAAADVRHVSLWRLGQEDPELWTVLQ